jgi:hypothetical protein
MRIGIRNLFDHGSGIGEKHPGSATLLLTNLTYLPGHLPHR